MSARTPYIISDEDRNECGNLFKGLSSKEGFVVLKRYLKEQGAIVPTLFKQYTELCQDDGVCFLDFNINTGWSDVVEGFIIADISCMKKNKKKRYIENYQLLHAKDSVTKLPNHANFRDIFTTLTRYQRKYDINFCLAIVRIENAEYLSQYLGETGWDDFMKAISKKIKKVLRSSDIIAKWESSEFIVLLKNIDPEDTIGIYKKLKVAIENVRVKSDLETTCSIGTALYISKESIDDTVQRVYSDLLINE